MITRLVAVLCAITMALAAYSQPAQRQNNRQQQMANAIIQGLQDAERVQSDPLALIFRKDVQRDMGLDLGQRNKFDNLHDRQVRDLLDARRQMRRNPAGVSQLQAAQQKETQDKMDELLTAEQKLRLSQISLQLQGNAILFQKDIQKQLALEPDQIQQLGSLRSQNADRVNELKMSAANGSTRPQDIPAQYQQIQTESSKAYADVLTQEQQDALKKMLGKPFKPVGS